MARCPECSFGRSWNLADGRHKCRACGQRFRPRSVWNASRLDVATKRKLLDYFVLGVPSFRLRFRGLANHKARERFYRLIRAALAHEEECREPFDGAVELDETMFGGYRPGKRGWGAGGKVIVFGLLKRNGVVRVSPVEKRSRGTVMALVQEHTKPGSLYYTDDWKAYASLKLTGDHVVVQKVKGKPRGKEHINGIEGFWSYAKHWLYNYRGVPRKHFHYYLGEISFRFNHRDEDLFPLVYGLLKRIQVASLP